MAIPSTGYDTATITNPSSALTDFTLIVDLSRMSTSWWADVNTSDGTRGRAAKNDGTTELACDWIDFDDTAETGLLRVQWSGTLASSGTQVIRIYPPNTANPAYGVSDTYGQYNAYDSNTHLYYPLDGLNDRTSTQDNLTGYNSPTFTSGKLGDAITLNGTNQGATISAGAWGTGSGHSYYAWVDVGTTGGNQEIIAADSGTSNERTFLLRANTSGQLNFISWNSSNILDINITGTTDLRPFGFVFVWVDFDTTNGAEIGYNTISEATSSTTATRKDGSTEIRAIGMETRDSFGEFLSGQIDEVVINNTKRVSAWRVHEYSQTNDNATFWGTWTWNAAGNVYNVSCSEDMALSDAQSASLEANVVFADTLTLSDTQSAVIEMFGSISDSITINDSVSAGAAVYNLEFSDTVTFSDIQTAISEYNASVSETITLNDGVSSGDTAVGRLCMTITGRNATITITGRAPDISIEGRGPSITIDGEGCT